MENFAGEDERITCSPKFSRALNQDLLKMNRGWGVECVLEETQKKHRGSQECGWSP